MVLEEDDKDAPNKGKDKVLNKGYSDSAHGSKAKFDRSKFDKHLPQSPRKNDNTPRSVEQTKWESDNTPRSVEQTKWESEQARLRKKVE